jgi:hypothetical protein
VGLNFNKLYQKLVLIQMEEGQSPGAPGVASKLIKYF